MKVGIIGAGTMGAGIAQAFAQVEGYEVALCDIKAEWAANGKAKLQKGFDKRIAKGKNLLRIAQGHASLVGQLQAAPALAEQVVAQPFLQLPDLPRKRLGCGVQLLARSHHAARFGNGPEVAQVLEVHSGSNTSKNSMNRGN